MASKQLEDFLRQQCKERDLSLRGLSLASGLSPGTVYNILNRSYLPSVFSLNCLADYLGIKREYLWQLAGLVRLTAYSGEPSITDPMLKFQFLQADKLPEPAKNLIIAILKDVITYIQPSDKDREPFLDTNIPPVKK